MDGYASAVLPKITLNEKLISGKNSILKQTSFTYLATNIWDHYFFGLIVKSKLEQKDFL